MRADLLAHDLPLFAGLTRKDFGDLDPTATLRRFAPWEMVFQQQDPGRDVYFLLSGALLALYWTHDGREVIFTRFATGAYFGEVAALDDGDRSLAVVARTDVSVLVLPQRSFRDMFDHIPTLRTRITRNLTARIRSLTERTVELTTLSVEERLSAYLMRLALERGQLRSGGVIDDAPTHAEIAASIGANREMVSRIITRLVQKGAIRSGRKHIDLIDPTRLSTAF
ncbi:MAG: Crp/Fnr family transcriptional regulator [Paracoccaceae bacterium]